MTTYGGIHGRGFSLLEAMAAVMTLAVVAALVSPVVSSSSEAYVSAMSTRRATERVGFAMERCIRLIREIPPSSGGGGVGLSSVASDSLTLEDGSGVRLEDGVLRLLVPGGGAATLLSGVTAFEVTALAADGTTSTMGSARDTRRINVRIESGGLGMSSAAFIRSGVSP